MPATLGTGTYGSGTYGGAGPSKPPKPIRVVQEFAPDNLSVIVREPNGGPIVGRWAQDEPNIENVFTGLTKSGEMPGGHKELNLSLPRDARRFFPDLGTYNDIEVQGPGGEQLWCGRLIRKPSTDGDQQSIQVVALGHQSLLENAKHIGPGFIDSDLTKWGEPSTQRRLDLLEAGVKLAGGATVGSQAAASALAAMLLMRFENLEGNPRMEAWYYGEGVDIADVHHDYMKLDGGPSPDEAWENAVRTSMDDVASTLDAASDHHKVSATHAVASAPGPGRKYAFISNGRSGSLAGNWNALDAWLPKVVGDYGLTLQGEWPDVGFTARQMVPVLAELAGLRTTEESLEDDGFVIPQAWFSDPEFLAAKLNEITKYSLLDWFVFGERLLQYRFPDTYGREWQASASQSGLRRTGEDGLRLWDEIIVRWQDTDGRTKTMGPPGSGAMIEDESLRITDPNHPAVKAGETRRDVLDLRSVSVESIARKTAARWLEEANELDHSGEAVLSGYVQDECGVWRPTSQVQPGDRVRFPDASDSSPRKVTNLNYTDEGKRCPVTLDAPPEGLKALEERYNARLLSRGTSA